MSGGSRRGLVLLAVAAIAVAGCRQPDQVDMARAGRQIASALSSRYHLPVEEVTCPTKEDVHIGTEFRCHVEIDGHPLVVAVSQRSARGDLGVQPTAAVLVMAQVRADMAETFRTQLGKKLVSTDCGHLQVEVVAPGGSIPCTVSNGAQTKHVTVKVLDADGTVSYDIR